MTMAVGPIIVQSGFKTRPRGWETIPRPGHHLCAQPQDWQPWASDSSLGNALCSGGPTVHQPGGTQTQHSLTEAIRLNIHEEEAVAEANPSTFSRSLHWPHMWMTSRTWHPQVCLWEFPTWTSPGNWSTKEELQGEAPRLGLAVFLIRPAG